MPWVQRHSTVQILADAGFTCGGSPDSACRCSHRWGDHILLPYDSSPNGPLKGGSFQCPDCLCTGTWDTGYPGTRPENN